MKKQINLLSGMMDNQEPERLQLNWNLNVKAVKKILGIRKALDKYADFQPLKEFVFGTLGYDHEEGLKFETTISKIPELIKWLKEFHNTYKVPFVFKPEYYAVSITTSTIPFSENRKKLIKKAEKVLKNCGLVEVGYDFVICK